MDKQTNIEIPSELYEKAVEYIGKRSQSGVYDLAGGFQDEALMLAHLLMESNTDLLTTLQTAVEKERQRIRDYATSCFRIREPKMIVPESGRYMSHVDTFEGSWLNYNDLMKALDPEQKQGEVEHDA